MALDAMFFINSILFGVGLAMDAFSVSVANGLRHPDLGRSRRVLIAGTFALFQTAMPLIGWFFVHAAAETFSAFSRFIPWIALALLLYIGGQMLWEGLRKKEEAPPELTGKTLVLQGLATSIDALSVGFTIAEFGWLPAVIQALIIGVVTFGICAVGLIIGKKAGEHLRQKAAILGGVILIGIWIESFVKGVFFS